jgi:Transglutaminase-like superfamily
VSRRLRAALALTPADWIRLGSAWWVLLAVHLAVAILPFRKIAGWTERETSRSRLGAEGRREAAESRRWLRMVRTAACHHVVEMNCLRQALALRWLLAVQGISTELQIGVHKTEERLLAHAWLELGGTPLGEDFDIGLKYLALAPAGNSP